MLNSNLFQYFKKSMRSSAILMILLMLMGTVQVFAFDIPKPTKLFYVNDTADLLSDEIEEYIINTNVDLCEKTDAQVVVVTINSLNGDSLEEYATALFREYGIGDKDKNNGVLLLLALEDRKSRIEVGYGLEGALNDAKTGRIQDDYMIPYFKEGNYSEGLKNGFDAILAEVATEYDVEITRDEPVRLAPTETDKTEYDYDSANTYGIVAMGIALVLGLIVGAIGGNGVISFFVCTIGSIVIAVIYGSTYGLGMGALILFGCLVAVLLGYAITADIDTGGSGGGYSGGSSSYHSSSSSSSSSSRSYSGGGGRSGGGGSSRSW